MIRATAGGPAPQSSARRPILALIYFALAVAGLVGTWFFNLTYTGPDYLADWFANRASSSAAVDLIVIVAVAATFYVPESRRLGWRCWIPIGFTVLSIGVAVSFALPLFLGLRERRLRRTDDR